MAPGEWPGDEVNVVASDTGFTLSAISQFAMSDMALILGSGSTGIQVNGAADSDFRDLYFTGASASYGVSINGDTGLEQHWTDCGSGTSAGPRST